MAKLTFIGLLKQNKDAIANAMDFTFGVVARAGLINGLVKANEKTATKEEIDKTSTLHKNFVMANHKQPGLEMYFADRPTKVPGFASMTKPTIKNVFATQIYNVLAYPYTAILVVKNVCFNVLDKIDNIFQPAIGFGKRTNPLFRLLKGGIVLGLIVPEICAWGLAKLGDVLNIGKRIANIFSRKPKKVIQKSSDAYINATMKKSSLAINKSYSSLPVNEVMSVKTKTVSTKPFLKTGSKFMAWLNQYASRKTENSQEAKRMPPPAA